MTATKYGSMKLLPTQGYFVIVLVAATAVVWTAGRASGIGFVLAQTKEELKLKYDVSVQDHGTGRVTVVFTLTDEGRLKPLDEVQLVIPGQEKNEDGGHWMDLVVSIDLTKMDGGKRVGRIHIRKELAERAAIRLNTHTMDGKLDPLTRLSHEIPIAKYMNNTAAQEKADKANMAKLVAEKFAKEFIQERNVAEAMKLTSVPFLEIKQGREQKPKKIEKSVDVKKQLERVVKHHDEIGIRAEVTIEKVQDATGDVPLDKSTKDVFNPGTDRIFVIYFDQHAGFPFELLTFVSWREDQPKVIGFALYFSR